MPTTKATITAKGQMTIPAAVRDSLGLKPGDTVAIELDQDKAILRKVRSIDVGWDVAVAATLSEWEDSLDDEL
jgi:AbrB family looped-hinge helix DNA binding protein